MESIIRTSILTIRQTMILFLLLGAQTRKPDGDLESPVLEQAFRDIWPRDTTTLNPEHSRDRVFFKVHAGVEIRSLWFFTGKIG